MHSVWKSLQKVSFYNIASEASFTNVNFIIKIPFTIFGAKNSKNYNETILVIFEHCEYIGVTDEATGPGQAWYGVNDVDKT